MALRILASAFLLTLAGTAWASVPAQPGRDVLAGSEELAECYGTYDALVALGDAGKLPAAEATAFAAQRSSAEGRAIAAFDAEGVNADLAREQLADRAAYMRSEFRDLNGGTGIHGLEDMKRMAASCDALLRP